MPVTDRPRADARAVPAGADGWLRPLRATFAYARERGWRGYDPYDGLLSPLARAPVVRDSRSLRLTIIQLVKRSPWNLRALLGIGGGVNPKALALFLSAAARAPADAGLRDQTLHLAESLMRVRTGDPRGASWGYHFPWQGRAHFLPAGTPNVVVTSFAGEAFLDAHAATGEERFLATALESCRFVLEGLNRTVDGTGVCLSYSPLDQAAVYNASLLGARLLVRAGLRAGRPDLIEAARPLVTYALARQQPDGSWYYGEAAHQKWVDSFHTGFVLAALDVYAGATSDPAVRSAVHRGADFYATRFFGPAGEPYYFPGRRYPYDIHSAAQGVLTFLQLEDLRVGFGDRAERAGRWMIGTLLGRNGRFLYQVRRSGKVRIPYMRWSQAWGVRALAELARCGVAHDENLD